MLLTGAELLLQTKSAFIRQFIKTKWSDSMKEINAYLIFNGNCREAVTFYQMPWL